MKKKATSNNKIKYEGYCVYLHVCIANEKIFYVGKGKGNRPWVVAKSGRSTKWTNFVNKYGPHRVELISTGLTESEAFQLECETIANAISNGINLVNLTSGGEGFAGGHHSTDTIETIRKFHLLKSEPLSGNPRRGVYFIKEDGNYSASITLSFGSKRTQYSLGRHDDVDDAISIREKAELAYIEFGLKGLAEFIENYRRHYDTHSTRRRSVVVVLKNKRLWFKGISEAAKSLDHKYADISNMLLGKSKSLSALSSSDKIYRIFYSKYNNFNDAEAMGELLVDASETIDINYRVEAGKSRLKPHLIGFDNGDVDWYPSLKDASIDLEVGSPGLIGVRKNKLKSLVGKNCKIIFVKESNFKTKIESECAGEFSIDLKDLIEKDYKKINAPNQIPHVAVDSNGKSYWFENAASMCRKLKFSNYGLLKKGKVNYLTAGDLKLVKVFESQFTSEELATAAGEI